MDNIELNGSWTLCEEGQSTPCAALVPGCVHTDLLAAGKIPDPFYRANEDSVRWIPERDWVYTRTFTVTPDILARDRVRLVCLGLDTLAKIRINGVSVGETDNMFRTWVFDVKNVLRTGDNTIEIRFDSVLRHVRRKREQYGRAIAEWKGSRDERHGNLVRKEPCNFGWDWGPVLVTCGIWRDIRIEAFSTARLDEVRVGQRLTAGKARLTVDVRAETVGRPSLSAAISVTYRGRVVAR